MTTDAPPPPPGATPPPPSGYTIVANGVSKHFGPLVAVSDVSFAIAPGVTALLGPNGAGKSTLLRMLSGLSPTSEGTITIAGGDPRNDAATRGRIGIVPQQDGVFDTLTGFEFVRLAATLNHVPNPSEAASSALQTVEMDATLTKKLATYSKGMRQRVKIAAAIVHQPTVLFLDEPLNGLDPRQRQHMVQLFQQIGDSGVTVVVSSHVLEEVERFGSRVLVIVNGRLAASGDFRAIRELMSDQPLTYRVGCSDARSLAAELIAAGYVESCTIASPTSFTLSTANAPALRDDIARLCQQHSVRLREFVALDADLESVFRYLVGDRK